MEDGVFDIDTDTRRAVVRTDIVFRQDFICQKCGLYELCVVRLSRMDPTGATGLELNAHHSSAVKRIPNQGS